eukprot:11185781-Lingulodinium_polyedra.AAC.1
MAARTLHGRMAEDVPRAGSSAAGASHRSRSMAPPCAIDDALLARPAEATPQPGRSLPRLLPGHR